MADREIFRVGRKFALMAGLMLLISVGFTILLVTTKLPLPSPRAFFAPIFIGVVGLTSLIHPFRGMLEPEDALNVIVSSVLCIVLGLVAGGVAWYLLA